MKAKEKTITLSPKMGEGIYTPIDVAQILKLPYHRVKYLMNTFWKEYTFGERGNPAINFFSLIEFYTYYNLRERNFTSAHIKKFHSELKRVLKTDYPFASVRVLDRKDKGHSRNSKIWYEYRGELLRDDRGNQPSIKSFIAPFLQQIEFGDDQLARRFFPFRHTNNIVVDPMHQFGQPVLNGTNLQTKAIFNLYDAGETKNNICKLYDISVHQVDDAIRLHVSRKVA